jgi:ABC-type transport system involved in multi-copper enzyme maturation permease subunit
MNANSIVLGGRVQADSSSPMTGFGRFLSKEAREWLRTRRFVIMAAVATVLALVSVMTMRLNQLTGQTGTPISLDPSYNLHMVGWDSFVPMFAAFGTMSLITAEREKGTLAWSLSMPLSRPAVLIAKLLAAVFFVGIGVVIIPEIVSVGVIQFAYNGFPHVPELFWEPLGGLAMALFVVTLNLAAGTFMRSQIAVVGTSFCTVITIWPLMQMLSKDLARFMPTSIADFFADYGKGAPTHPESLVSWAIATALLVIVAIVQFRRREI